MALPVFAHLHPLSTGVEFDMQTVSPTGWHLTPVAADLLRQVEGRRVPGEISPKRRQTVIEMASGICGGHADALAQLSEIREVLVEASDPLAAGLNGGGTHPFQDWSQRAIYDTPGFKDLDRRDGCPAQQFPLFGLPVHVGCPDPDPAMARLQGLSRHVPHLMALPALSPCGSGVDTCFDSARLNSVRAFPRSDPAPITATWDGFITCCVKKARTSIATGRKDFYGDSRPKPEFVTIEVRALPGNDAPWIRKSQADAASLPELVCLQVQRWAGRVH